MVKSKIREINITESKGAFSALGVSLFAKEDYDFEGIIALKRLLNNEKAKILHVIKTEKPSSIYSLAKKLGRGFKAVNDDLKLLERFGFVEFIKETTKKRIRKRPVLTAEKITININF